MISMMPRQKQKDDIQSNHMGRYLLRQNEKQPALQALDTGSSPDDDLKVSER